MIKNQTNIRVRYADTDQMGYVHHSNYARYYETARWELLREKLGITYKMIEDAGYLLPVINLSSRFVKPAFYDDVLTIETLLKPVENCRLIFQYSLYNEAGEKINTGESTVAFTGKENRKPCRPPLFFVEAYNIGLLKGSGT